MLRIYLNPNLKNNLSLNQVRVLKFTLKNYWKNNNLLI